MSSTTPQTSGYVGAGKTRSSSQRHVDDDFELEVRLHAQHMQTFNDLPLYILFNTLTCSNTFYHSVDESDVSLRSFCRWFASRDVKDPKLWRKIK